MAKLRDLLVRLALLLAVLLPVWFLVATLGTKFGLFDYRIGFGQMTYGLGDRVIYTVLAVGVLALALARLIPPRRGLVAAVVAVLIPVLAIGYGNYARSQSRGYPAIHDVTTNPTDPPSFSAELLKVRTDSKSNTIYPPTMPMKERASFQRMLTARPDMAAALADKSVADLAAEGFPDLRPIELSIPPSRAFMLAQEEAKAQGWKIHAADPEQGVLDATAETFWFGFKDDVAIRVRPGGSPDTSVVDLRSISRVGGGDMGANGKRIRAFSQGILERVGPA